MKEEDLQVFIVGFIAYPIVKWLLGAIWDKICTDAERVTRPIEDD